MHVTPAPGLKLRDPETMTLLPNEGWEVPETEYWLRRISDGDAILSQTTKSSEAVAPKAATKKSSTVPAETGSVS